jgi:hypothetical protein
VSDIAVTDDLESGFDFANQKSEPIDHKGQLYHTGLHLPRPGTASAFPDAAAAVPELSEADILTLIRDSGRTRRRKLFGPDKIGDQKSKSSCNGFAAAFSLARARVLAGQDWVRLSGAAVYAPINGNRDQGSMLDDGMRVIQERGAPTEARVPWDRIFMSQIPADAWEEAAKYKAFECYQTRDKMRFLSGLALGWVGVVAVHAGNNFMQLSAAGVAGADRGPGNHAVGVDDLVEVDGVPHADMFNSWTANWGDQGRCYLNWERHLAQTTQWHSFYLLRGSTLSPDNAQPPVAG